MDQDSRELKKRWKAEQMSKARATFPLPDTVLAEMFAATKANVGAGGCDDTARHTRRWLSEQGHPVDSVMTWLEENGGYCDCEIVANAREAWEENRWPEPAREARTTAILRDLRQRRGFEPAEVASAAGLSVPAILRPGNSTMMSST